MTLAVLQIICSFAGIAFLVQAGFVGRRQNVLDNFNISVLLGLMSVGFIAYLVAPSLITEVSLLPNYSPHAYNLIIWSGFGLVLRKVFSPRSVLPTLILVYCIDELLWNGLAAAYFGGDMSVMGYLLLPSWHVFILALVSAGAVCYLIVKPRLKVNVMWAFLAAFGFLWAWVAGFPVLAVTNIGDLSFYQVLYRLCWEVMWQAVILAWAYATFSPRASQTMPPLPRPFVG